MIYVDADACPVKAEVERDRQPPSGEDRLVSVSNGGIRPSAEPAWWKLVMVREGADVADKHGSRTERRKAGDVVITGDIPLGGTLRRGRGRWC